MEDSERSLSVTSLALLFMLGVVVCAVFFSLGFLVGYRERSSSNETAVERVTPSAESPPVVNPPPEKQETSLRHDATAVPGGPTAQPLAAESGQKSQPGPDGPVPAGSREVSGKVASAVNALAQNARSGAAAAAVQGAAAVPGNLDASAAPSPVPTKGPATGGMVLQVAALQRNEDAERLVKVLKERGYPVFLVTPQDAHANDNLVRVRVGPFTSGAEKEKTRRKLEMEGFKPFVKR